jgi:copper chaperone CopZ
MKTTISIEGMSCEHCAAHVTKALKETAGVRSAKVSLKEKNALVEHADTVSPDTLKAAINEAL